MGGGAGTIGVGEKSEADRKKTEGHGGDAGAAQRCRPATDGLAHEAREWGCLGHA